MCGSYESRSPCAVAERLPDFSDQAGQIRFRYERRRPEVLVQLVLRQRARALIDQRLEQLERLGREVNFLAASQELPRIRVERDVAESESHRVWLQKTHRIPMIPQ